MGNRFHPDGLLIGNGCLLAAALITVAAFVRSSEATAFLSSGVSLYRLATPLLLLSASASVVHFLLAERVVPRASAESAVLKARLKGVAPPPSASPAAGFAAREAGSTPWRRGTRAPGRSRGSR